MSWERDHEWERSVTEQLRRRTGGEWQGITPTAWKKGLLGALVSRDEVEEGDLRWHVSVSHPERVPTWEELADAVHSLRPGVVFVIPLPPRSWWINVHPNVLHAQETHDEPLIAQFRAEGKGHQPT